MIPVCVFAKPPQPGNVKTRLIPELGREGAAELAAAMFMDTWHTLSSTPGVRPILATVTGGVFPVAIDTRDVWLQGDGNLSVRLERILRRSLTDAAGAIAIGADSPCLTVTHLQAAIRSLEDHDAVIGRAMDGGFYLLGLHECPEGLLSCIPWSTCEAAESTAQRLRHRKMKVHELAPLFDVDLPEDLRVLAGYLLKNPAAAPATRAWCVSKRFLENGR
jgi:rSAM/selenodomain-associated transferase 1